MDCTVVELRMKLLCQLQVFVYKEFIVYCVKMSNNNSSRFNCADLRRVNKTDKVNSTQSFKISALKRSTRIVRRQNRGAASSQGLSYCVTVFLCISLCYCVSVLLFSVTGVLR